METPQYLETTQRLCFEFLPKRDIVNHTLGMFFVTSI